MFEDKTQSNAQPVPGLDNLNKDKPFPFKKVDDSPDTDSSMNEKRLSGMKGPVEDILAGTDNEKTLVESAAEENVVKEPILKETPHVPAMEQPRVESMPRISGRAAQSAPIVSTPPLTPQVSGSKNKVFTILLSVFIIIILGLTGVFAYQFFTQDKNQSLDDSSLETDNSQNLDDLLNILEQNQTGEETEDVEEEDLPEENYYIDTDKDGLTDEEEIELGINPNKFDTDNDGLSDFEEVEIYHSDPINPDTDDDGYEDGNEVENGYDPLRAGNARL